MTSTPIAITMESGSNKTYYEEKGKITSAKMDMETTDYRCLSFYLMFEFESAGQGFGGNVLGREEDYDKPHNVDLRDRINRLFETDNWSQIVGKTAYAIRDNKGLNAAIVGIKSEKGYMFFIDHWRKDHFGNMPEFKQMNLPIRYERPTLPIPHNRLDGVQ